MNTSRFGNVIVRAAQAAAAIVILSAAAAVAAPNLASAASAFTTTTIASSSGSSATCPSGYRVTGGGYRGYASSSTAITVTESKPSGSSGWSTKAYKIEPYLATSLGKTVIKTRLTSTSVPTYAVCVR